MKNKWLVAVKGHPLIYAFSSSLLLFKFLFIIKLSNDTLIFINKKFLTNILNDNITKQSSQNTENTIELKQKGNIIRNILSNQLEFNNFQFSSKDNKIKSNITKYFCIFNNCYDKINESKTKNFNNRQGILNKKSNGSEIELIDLTIDDEITNFRKQ